MAKSVALVLQGGKRKRRVQSSRRSWTPAKERAFLVALTESCNVTLAARTARFSISGVYERRRKHASFRSAWDGAIATGYAQLELMLLERALHGVEKVVVEKDGSKTVMREYSDRVALALLKMHRDTARIADEPVDEIEFQEARDRIVARIERLREQAAA